MDKDTHLEMPREGWVTARLRYFLFRLQTHKAPGILQPLQDDSGSSLQIHIREQPDSNKSALLHFPPVSYKPNHLQYSLPLTLLVHYFSQVERSILKSNNLIAAQAEQLHSPSQDMTKPHISQKDHEDAYSPFMLHQERGTILKLERSISFQQSPPNSSTKNLPYSSINHISSGRDLLIK